MDVHDLLMTAIRASLVYFFLLFVIRVLGKREVGSVTAFDFMVGLMLGEVVDEIVFADVTLVKGFLAISVIAIWHFVNSWASYRSKLIDRLTGSSATVLVENGEIRQDALAKERMSEDELWAELRMMGVEKLEEVKRAMLEPTGQVSVIKQDWAQPLRRKDLQQARGQF